MLLVPLIMFCIGVLYGVYKYNTRPIMKPIEELERVKSEQVLAAKQVELVREKKKLNKLKENLEG